MEEAPRQGLNNQTESHKLTLKDVAAYCNAYSRRLAEDAERYRNDIEEHQKLLDMAQSYSNLRDALMIRNVDRGAIEKVLHDIEQRHLFQRDYGFGKEDDMSPFSSDELLELQEYLRAYLRKPI